MQMMKTKLLLMKMLMKLKLLLMKMLVCTCLTGSGGDLLPPRGQFWMQQAEESAESASRQRTQAGSRESDISTHTDALMLSDAYIELQHQHQRSSSSSSTASHHHFVSGSENTYFSKYFVSFIFIFIKVYMYIYIERERDRITLLFYIYLYCFSYFSIFKLN